ncbi:MAG TPA: APC family permease [Anaerolineales bacterium]|nr:APC family permease [Anaerolineales bacterium]HRF50489.1 APC family permease [Anaerolineales bacterium]
MSTTIISGPEAGPERSWRHWLTGRPLATAEAPHQTISKKVGLAVFASDALSSTAYATDEILIVLAAAGALAYGISLPIAIAIIILLVIVTISYEQTIHAYPGGGGAYIVARDNLGEFPAQIAGAALLTDYILTVAVSISSGVAQITSAFQDLRPYKVEIALAFIAFMTLINLRGVKESGIAFAVPTYFFLITTLFTIGVGYYQFFTGTLGSVSGIEPIHEATQGLTAFLVLRAFSSGCTALTGVEAISNGITAFKEPRSRNAGITLIWMTTILSTMFFSITFLARATDAVPSHVQTIFSQVGSVIYGAGSLPYLALLGSTTLILVMAANTAYADFPRLAALAAGDGFLPKQLTYRGSRLVFSYGIIVLAAVAALLVMAFQAETTALIPLYAIGVFLSFTLSQSGMAVRWWRSRLLKPGDAVQRVGSVLHHEPNWKLKMVVNGFGAAMSFVVMIIFAVTKFSSGAWIIVIVIPTLVFVFYQIHRHYQVLARKLSLDTFGAPTRVRRNRVILPIGGVHRGTLHALNYARSLSDDVTAVHIALDQAEESKLRDRWETWGDGVRLVLIPSPYRALIEPMVGYIRNVAAQRQTGDILTVVVPEFLPEKPWQNILHMQTVFFLRMGLLGLRNIVIIEVPYHGDAA